MIVRILAAFGLTPDIVNPPSSSASVVPFSFALDICHSLGRETNKPRISSSHL
jgi:hypothetical protein